MTFDVQSKATLQKECVRMRIDVQSKATLSAVECEMNLLYVAINLTFPLHPGKIMLIQF